MAMTHKMFIHRANGRISVKAFLESQKEFLASGSLKERCEPILVKMHNKEIMPTEAIKLIKKEVLDDLTSSQIKEFEQKQVIKQEKLSAKEQLQKEKEPKEEKKPKNYRATIYNNGVVVEKKVDKEKSIPMSMGFDKHQDAVLWASRRLTEGAEGWYAEVVSTKLLDRLGLPMKTKIERRIAFANLLPTNKGKPMMKIIGKKNGSLTSRMKAKGSHCNFSRG